MSNQKRLPHELIRKLLEDNLETIIKELFKGGNLTPIKGKGRNQVRISGLGLGGLEVVTSGSQRGNWFNLSADTGGDIVSLISWAKWGTKSDRQSAWEWAARRFGLDADGIDDARKAKLDQERRFEPREKHARAQDAEDDDVILEIVNPVPKDVQPVFPKKRVPTQRWAWKNADGSIAGYTYRIEWWKKTKDGDVSKEKIVLPLVYAKVREPSGQIVHKWIGKGIPQPAPLYGLPELIEGLRAGKDVIVVEGEKKVAAARLLFSEMVATTSGSSSSAKTRDFSPLATAKGRIFIWPDADAENIHGTRSGLLYAERIAEKISEVSSRPVYVVGVAGQSFRKDSKGRWQRAVGRQGGLFDVVPDGWDLADDLPNGWSEATLQGLLEAAEPLLPMPEDKEPERRKRGRTTLQTGIPPYFAKKPLPAFAASAELDKTLNGFFAGIWGREDERLAIKGAAGLGKSTKTALLLGKYAGGRNVEIYVPDHGLALHWKGLVETANPELVVRVIRGRSHGADRDQAPCVRWRAAEAVAMAGLSVHDHLCQSNNSPEDGLGDRGNSCPYFDRCPYLEQFKSDRPEVRIFVHQHLSLARNQGLPDPDLVIVDERFAFHLAPVRDFGLDRLEAKRNWALLGSKAYQAAWFRDVAHATSQALRESVQDGQEAGLIELLRRRGLSADDFEEMAELEAGFAPKTTIRPDMDEAEQIRLAEAYRPFRIVWRFWRQIEKEMRLGRVHSQSIRLRTNVPSGLNGERQDKIRLGWRRDVRFAYEDGYEIRFKTSAETFSEWEGIGWNRFLQLSGYDVDPPADMKPCEILHRNSLKLMAERFKIHLGSGHALAWGDDKELRRKRNGVPVLILDADADPLLLDAVLPGTKLVDIQTERRCEVIQVWDTRNSKHRMIAGERAATVQSDILSLLMDEREKPSGLEPGINRKILLVAPKRVEEELIGHVPAGVDTAHFGAIRGLDHWRDHDTVIVAGREQPSTDELEDMAAAFFWDAAKPILRLPAGQDLPEVERGFRMKSPARDKDAPAFGVAVPVHPDPRVQAVLEQLREAEIAQAVDRLRLVHAEKPKRVILMTNIVCDITVDRLLSWREAVAGGDRLSLAWQRSGGVLPLAYAELSGRFPELWGSENAARSWFRGKSSESLIEALKAPLLLVSYRRQGQRRPSRAVISAELQDPLAALELLVGRLEGFRIEREIHPKADLSELRTLESEEGSVGPAIRAVACAGDGYAYANVQPVFDSIPPSPYLTFAGPDPPDTS